MPQRKAAESPAKMAQVTIERVLPPAILDRDALRDIAEILGPLGPQRWEGKRRGTTVEAPTYEEFADAASYLETLDHLEIHAGEDPLREGAYLYVWSFSARVRITSSCKPRPEIERTAGKIVDVCRLHRRAIFGPIQALVGHPLRSFVINAALGSLIVLSWPGSLDPGFGLVGVPLAVMAIAVVTFAFVAPPVRVTLAPTEPFRRSNLWGTAAQFVLAVLASLVAGALLTLYLSQR